MPPLPPLNALKAFEASGRHLNFRLAAEEIGVTQGAVAQQVRGLERRLGVMLFERQPKGLALTEEGRRYFATLRRAFEMMATATAEIQPQGAVVTISVTSSFAAKWLVPRLGRFAEENPDIQVKLEASDRLASFQSDGVDIAVRQGAPPFGPGLTAEPLAPLQLIAVCSPVLLQGAHPLQDPDDLAHHVLLQDSHGFWPLFLDSIFGERPQPRIRSMEFSLTSLALDAAMAGQGVALASRLFVEEELASGRLCQAFAEALDCDFGFYCLATRAPRQPLLVARIRRWLASQVAGSAAVQGE